MKMIKCFVMALAVAVCMTTISCSKENDEEIINDSLVPLSLTLCVNEISTRAGEKKTFASNDEMGLFISQYNTLTDYNPELGANRNVKATYNGTSWSTNEVSYLSRELATVWGYYPYNSQVTDITRIPVDMNKHIDYLYGKSENTNLNNQNPVASVAVKHACAQLQFTISSKGFFTKDKLKKIELSNKSGKNALYSEGVLNGQTGVITGTKNGNVYFEYEGVGKTILESPGSTAYTSLFVIPTQTAAYGDIVFKFHIGDRDTYSWGILPPTKWEAGKIYKYHVELSGSQIILGDPTINAWNPTDGSVTVKIAY